MARIAVDQTASGSTTLITSYDSTKWNLGSIIKQYTGSQSTDNFIGPCKIAQAKIPEESTTYQISFLDGFAWSSRYDWVFGHENTTGTTRRITAYQYDRDLSVYTWRGFITFTMVSTGTHTSSGFSVQYYTHTTGTISASGQTVTGSGTLFQTQRIAVGARIGFGSTDPTQIVTWYVISGITNDTTLTISQVLVSSISAGTAYVIEELRFAISTTNATTATNGGVFVAKGINWEDFSPGGTTIGASSGATDNLKLTYWLADTTPNITNTVTRGAAVDGTRQTSFGGLTHSLYVIDNTRARVYSYNLRANDTIVTGRMTLTASNIIQTATQSFQGTGAVPQTNPLVLVTASHSVGNGVKSLYFVTNTTSRLYRSAISNITSGNTSWQSENRTEVPPGGTNTMATSNVFNTIEYDNESDRFLILTTHGTSVRSYYTRYPANSGDQFDFAFLNNFLSLDGSTSDPRQVPIPYNTLANPVYCKCINGITHLNRQGSANTAGLHALFAIPIAAHWDFAASTNEVAISPVINTLNINKYSRLIINQVRTVGQDPFTIPTNAIRAYYRTTGISDNSGDWNLIGATGDLSGVNGTNQIQFRFEFQMLGNTFGIPGRLLGFTLIYDDLSTDSHYEPSVTYSDVNNKRFAWRFATAFGTTVPTLRIRLYDASTNGNLLDDTTTSQSFGTFQRSTDGGLTWGTYSTSDKTNEDTYIRYTPTSLADNIRVRSLLTLN
jgi:hypothetical protein